MPHVSGHAQPFRVYVSMAAFPHIKLVRLSVESALLFVQPHRLALHISSSAATDKMRLSFSRAEAVVHNPHHILVKKHSSQVLAIHLSNFALLDELDAANRPQSNDRVLILPGNAILIKPCGRLLQSAPLSFGSESFTDVRQQDRDASERWAQQPIVAPRQHTPGGPQAGNRFCNGQPCEATVDCRAVPLKDPLDDANVTMHAGGSGMLRWASRLKGPPSKAWDTSMAQVRRGNDLLPWVAEAACTRNSFFRTYFGWLWHTDGLPLHSGPLALSTHEGSWYTTEVLRAALAAFRGTDLDWRNLSLRCPHAGWCSAEETVLPTFVWQRFPSLVAQSQPPLLARTLSMVSCGDKTSCAPCHRSPGSLASLVAFARRSSNWCGIKIARDDNEEMMRAVLTDVLRCRGRCKPGGPEGIGRAHSVAREDDWPCWSAGFWKRVDSDYTSTP